MGKSKKTKDYRKDSKPIPETIRFEIEENAVQLMEEHLALFKPSPKDADTLPAVDHSKRVTSKVIEIDLHGLRLEDAERRVMELTQRFPYNLEARTFKIITGKGRHSSGGQGVLIREIYRFVKARFGPHIVTIEESPDAVRIGGTPLRGHFHVTLRGP